MRYRHGFGLQCQSLDRLIARYEVNRLLFSKCGGLLPLRNQSLGMSYTLVSSQCRYSTHAKTEQKSRKMLMYLTGLVFAMVGLSYAAVPLYRRFCQATGYGGTVQRREVS